MIRQASWGYIFSNFEVCLSIFSLAGMYYIVSPNSLQRVGEAGKTDISMWPGHTWATGDKGTWPQWWGRRGWSRRWGSFKMQTFKQVHEFFAIHIRAIILFSSKIHSSPKNKYMFIYVIMCVFMCVCYPCCFWTRFGSQKCHNCTHTGEWCRRSKKRDKLRSIVEQEKIRKSSWQQHCFSTFFPISQLSCDVGLWLRWTWSSSSFSGWWLVITMTCPLRSAFFLMFLLHVSRVFQLQQLSPLQDHVAERQEDPEVQTYLPKDPGFYAAISEDKWVGILSQTWLWVNERSWPVSIWHFDSHACQVNIVVDFLARSQRI